MKIKTNVKGGYTKWSDRNMKDNFEKVDVTEVLEKVANLEVTVWNYKTEATRHIGPMAQDFMAAFGMGDTDRMIDMVDANGVALAAIQGLCRKLNEKDAQIALLAARLTALEAKAA